MLCLPSLVFIHVLLPSVGGAGLEAPNNNLTLLSLSLFVAVQAFAVKASDAPLYLGDRTMLLGAGVALLLASAVVSGWGASLAPVAVSFWFFFYLFLQQMPADTGNRSILWVVFISAAIESVLGLAQTLGWVAEIGGSRLDTGGTPVGGIQQSNLFASYTITGLASWLWLMLDERDATRLISNKLLTATAGGLITAMAILTGSRTGWFSLAAVTILGSIALCRLPAKGRFISWCGSAIAGVILAALLTSVTENNRVANKAHWESPRWPLLEQSVRLAGENLLQGVGYGNFQRAYVESAARNFANGNINQPAMSNFRHAHNGLLQWQIEGGLLAMAGLLIISAAVGLQLLGLPQPIRLAYLAFILPVGLHFMTEYPLRQSVIHGWLLVVGVYLGRSDRITLKIPAKTIGPYLTAIILLCGFIVPIYCVNNLNSIYWLREIQNNPVANAKLAPKILYPGPLEDKIENTLANSLYLTGLQYQFEPALDAYISWASREQKETPRAGLFEQLIRAQTARGDDVGAERTAKKYAFYFPQRASLFVAQPDH